MQVYFHIEFLSFFLKEKNQIGQSIPLTIKSSQLY